MTVPAHTPTRRHIRPSLVGAAVFATGAALLAAPGLAAADPPRPGSDVVQRAMVVKVAHGPVTGTLMPAVAGKLGSGDLRTYYTPLKNPATRTKSGFMTGSLLTTAVDRPRTGWELRTADLVFQVGGPADQLVVGGVARYRAAAATVPRRDVVVRPIVGGSGRYDGAHGWCKTIHRRDNTWRHIFRFTVND